MPRPVVIPFLPFQPGGRDTVVTRVCAFSPAKPGVVAWVGGCSRLSLEDSSMMLSRDARELKCGRERERGSRRVRCVGEESGEA
jgi:hypothetical protein